ncbi:MAG TPA: radical SAM protein [Nitrospirota bacterium]
MATNRPFDFFIQWHVTEACNLSCKHCYQGEQKADEMPLQEMRDIISEVSDMLADWSDTYGVSFSRSFNVTGGEPFLRPDLFDILEEIRRHDIDMSLLTNGTLVTRERAKMLADLGVKGVQVSIDGPEDVHDGIRGAGSFRKAAAGIEHLIDCGIPVTLNMTLSALNVAEVNKVITLGSHMGAQRVGFSRLVPDGRARSLVSRMLSSEQVLSVYSLLKSYDINGLEVVTGDPLASQTRRSWSLDAGNVALSGCAAGVSGLTIYPNGDVMPCRRMPIPVGNVRRDSLREIWATSPVLTALRDRSRYMGKCGRCGRWAHCRGCRAIAYAYSRSRGEDDFLADDPQCFRAA